MRDFFGTDDEFTRTVPQGAVRTDVGVALVLMVLAISGVLGYWSLPEYRDEVRLAWSIPLIVLAGIMISLRRMFPVWVLLLCTGVHFIVVGSLLPIASAQPGMQVLYFLGLYSAMAWARNREALMITTIAVLLAMTAWVAINFSINGAPYIAELDASPLPLLVSQVLINVAYFGAATWLGRNAWLKARGDAQLVASRELVEEQADQLASQAIVGERLRISRELHDSLAHHVALIGLQTAAARRTMDKKPQEAKEALLGAERSARHSVKELRMVLGSLRSGDEDVEASGLDSLPALLSDNATLGLVVHLSLVGDAEALDHLPRTLSTTLYRIVQEALSNVRTHSTASSARLTVRAGERLVEAEIVDDGHPIAGAGGSKLGQLGIRERVSALGGTAEIGPRTERGYRVLVRLPLPDGGA